MTEEDKVTDDKTVTDTRRRRYRRAAPDAPLLALTPPKAAMLRFLAECRLLSLPQLARLVCPAVKVDSSQKAARRHLRALFDAGLVDVLPVARAALAGPAAANDETLLHGSAPNVYVPTGLGLDALHRAGWIDGERRKMALSRYGPKNSLFLAHELQVRDVRVWLEECARASAGEQAVLKWTDGMEATLPFEGGCARPDAWFVYQLRGGEPPKVLVGLVEVDRGTERGDRHWSQKVAAYAGLFESGQLAGLTGYHRARVLIFAPDTVRRDAVRLRLEECAQDRDVRPSLDRFWLADKHLFREANFFMGAWNKAGSAKDVPLFNNNFPEPAPGLDSPAQG